MKRRSTFLAFVALLAVVPVGARQDPAICGTYRGRLQAELQLHRRAERVRRGLGGVRMSEGGAAAGVVAAPLWTARPDVNNIAIIEASDGVVMQANSFDLAYRTVTFTPSGQTYQYSLAGAAYDDVAAAQGSIVGGLGDDDSRLLTLPFAFPFYGKQYNQVYLNSDGNLTFGQADHESSARSLARITAGPPRIAPLFEDLDPSKYVGEVTTDFAPDRAVVSWRSVPEYQDTGIGRAQTFQVRLYPDGRIEFAWSAGTPTAAVVGISPGNMDNSPSLVDFSVSGGPYSATVAERFGSSNELDFFMIGQRFYATHDDAYDYLIIFNGLGMKDGQTSLASTRVVRNRFTGNGDIPVDYGTEFGSPSRLQAVIHMAYPGQYPADLTTKLWTLGRPTDSSVGVLAHEVGHLWLAYASNREPENPNALPMLGYGYSHWSFNFNSEASLLEGETIQDLGGGLFQTVDATNRYSPLDLYLMGLRPSWDVEPLHSMFYVAGSSKSSTLHPAIGVQMTGTRRNVAIDEILSANGRRTPDFTVSQKWFRFAFIYVVPKDQQPSQADLDKIGQFRTMFEPYFRVAADNRAVAQTALQRSLQITTFPAAGVLAGSTATATITVSQPLESALTVSLSSSGLAGVPSQVTIPAGGTAASFTFQGVRAGVDDLVATPATDAYATVHSNIQVLDSAAGLRLQVVSGNDQSAQPNLALAEPVVLRIVDQNLLPYPGMRVSATVRDGGSLEQSSLTSDPSGYVRFNWTMGAGSLNELTAVIDGAPATATAVYAWSAPAFTNAGFVNAASYTHEVAPGALASLFGVNLAPEPAWASYIPLPVTLAGTQVIMNGTAVPLLYVSPLQVNFQVPESLAAGPAAIRVQTTFGASTDVPVTVVPYAPAIFDDPEANVGAVLVAGEGQKTDAAPAKPEDYVEIYCTGLGPVAADGRTTTGVQVYIAEQLITDVPYAGLSGGYVGLYQVNARVPAGLAPGRYPVSLAVAGKTSNTVYIEVR